MCCAVHILLHLCMNTIIIYACTSILVHWTMQTALHRSVLLTHSICNFGFTNGKMLLLFKIKTHLHYPHSMHSEFGIPTKKTFILWARTQEFERSLIFRIIKILDFHCHVFAWYKPAVLMNESTNQRIKDTSGFKSQVRIRRQKFPFFWFDSVKNAHHGLCHYPMNVHRLRKCLQYYGILKCIPPMRV